MDHFILVTGASSGIGESACRTLIREGYKIIGLVRTDQDALRLKSTYGQHMYPLIADVTDPKRMDSARIEAELIIGTGSLVSIFNSAGIAVSGAALYIPLKEWKHLFDVNVFGTICTIQVFFSLLVRKPVETDLHPRRIINVSSISGRFASPFLGPYVSSKFALEAFSDCLRRELFMYDVQVVILQPGNIVTPMWEKAKTNPTYLGPEYESIREFKDQVIDQNISQSLPVEALDKTILKVIRNKHVKTRYLVRKDKWKFLFILALPHAWVDKLIRKKLQQRSNIRPF
jgi:NAD(P)-dependent dehydrogenase (short-subunit alcohol dehydrogenase family)